MKRGNLLTNAAFDQTPVTSFFQAFDGGTVDLLAYSSESEPIDGTHVMRLSSDAGEGRIRATVRNTGDYSGRSVRFTTKIRQTASGVGIIYLGVRRYIGGVWQGNTELPITGVTNNFANYTLEVPITNTTEEIEIAFRLSGAGASSWVEFADFVAYDQQAMLEQTDSTQFSETHEEDGAVDNGMTGGWVGSRPRSRRRPRRIFNIGLTDIPEDQKEWFLQLVRDVRGSAGIIRAWEHPVTQERINVRFADPTSHLINYRGAGYYRRWDIRGITLVEV